jgi:hypothetical protein
MDCLATLVTLCDKLPNIKCVWNCCGNIYVRTVERCRNLTRGMSMSASSEFDRGVTI